MPQKVKILAVKFTKIQNRKTGPQPFAVTEEQRNFFFIYYGLISTIIVTIHKYMGIDIIYLITI